MQGFELIGRMGWEFLAETAPRRAARCSRCPTGRCWWSWACPGDLAPADALEWLYVEGTERRPRARRGAGRLRRRRATRSGTCARRIPEANRRIGSISSHDISLPLSEIPAFLREAEAAIAALGPFRINAFGHLGDGNLHYNVFPDAGAPTAPRRSDLRGAGQGRWSTTSSMPGAARSRPSTGSAGSRSPTSSATPTRCGSAMMRAVKAALDPQGILNPGAVLRQA